MLRPVRFVQADEDVFRANAKAFTDKTGVEVKVDFVGWEDINQQTAVTANSGAGPDIIIGFNDAPHIYVEKVLELSDVADYLGKRYGGWMTLAQRYGKRYKTENWIGLPFGASGGPLVYRKSIVQAAGFEKVPDDHAGVLALCKKLKESGNPPALRSATRSATATASPMAAVVAQRLGAGRRGQYHHQQQGDHRGAEISEGALSDLHRRHPVVERRQQNRAYSGQEIALTANGVSLYFSLKNDPAMKAIAEDTQHQLLPKGVASTSPMAGLTMNAMVFKHSAYPNAAKALLQFLLEKEQYEPWLNANSGYWAQPLAAYADSAVWSGDPKVSLFKDTMKSPY